MNERSYAFRALQHPNFRIFISGLAVSLIGTAAWFFLIVNVSKVPLSWHLGLINADSWALDLKLVPFAVFGAVSGRLLIGRVDQKLFDAVALALAAVAAIRLCL